MADRGEREVEAVGAGGDVVLACVGEFDAGGCPGGYAGFEAKAVGLDDPAYLVAAAHGLELGARALEERLFGKAGVDRWPRR